MPQEHPPPLPSTYRALVLTSASRPTRVQSRPLRRGLLEASPCRSPGTSKRTRASCSGPEGAWRTSVYFDISPPQAAGSTHLASAFRALGRGARVSLMGGIMADVALPHAIIMHKDITIKGKWMYPREAIPELVRMVEVGQLKLGSPAGTEAERYGLGDWEAAFQAAEASEFG